MVRTAFSEGVAASRHTVVPEDITQADSGFDLLPDTPSWLSLVNSEVHEDMTQAACGVELLPGVQSGSHWSEFKCLRPLVDVAVPVCSLRAVLSCTAAT